MPKKLAIIGAGPKALAIIAKAHVLKKIGIPIPEIHLFEKHEVGAHWAGGYGFTSGHLPLGTPPEKDLGYPYQTTTFQHDVNTQIDIMMQKFSWQNYLISKGEYSEWVDRGKPAPLHKGWADYLKWVFQKTKSGIHFYNTSVEKIDVNAGKWEILFDHQESRTLIADGIVITGPGDTETGDTLISPNILSAESFWRSLPELEFKSSEKVVVVGGGETAAAIVATLLRKSSAPEVGVMTSKGHIYSRGESYLENRVYSNPSHANWKMLKERDRSEFISRTDRGVFSIDMQRIIDHSPSLEIIPGHWKSQFPLENGRLKVNYSYNNLESSVECDWLIIAGGGSTIKFLKTLSTDRTMELFKSHLGNLNTESLNWRRRIDYNLALEGLTPNLHLPSLAGLQQGPGFANLSSLGSLSDRILNAYMKA